jgi:hypothetical protein
MNIQLIPLGIRCNAAYVTDAIVKQPRLPFDWTQMNVNSMIDVLFLKKEHIQEYWTKYFSNLDANSHHNETRSWFPHDEFKTPEEKEATIQKYIRRTHRLVDMLNSPIPKVFLIFFGYPENNSMERAQKLILSIGNRVNTQHRFLIWNAKYQEIQMENISFFYEKLPEKGEDEKNDTWNMLTKAVEKRVRQILLDNKLQPISFQPPSS